jgi:hypothetical protein
MTCHTYVPLSDPLPRASGFLRFPACAARFPFAPTQATVKASRVRFFEVHSRGFCTRCLRTSGPPLHKLCRQSPCIGLKSDGPLVRTRFRRLAAPFRMRCAFRRSHEVISKGFSYFLLSRAFVTQCQVLFFRNRSRGIPTYSMPLIPHHYI